MKDWKKWTGEPDEVENDKDEELGWKSKSEVEDGSTKRMKGERYWRRKNTVEKKQRAAEGRKGKVGGRK